jgi:AcrR family transcriptional regulator
MTPAATTTPTQAGVAATGSRQMILDTAARLFRARGYASVSLRDIAGDCGMKAGSLYYHFSSKDAIVTEVLRLGVERVYEEVQRAVAALAPDAPAEEVFRTAIRSHLRALLELQDYTSANIRIFGQVPQTVRSSHLGLRDAYERCWSDLLTRYAPPAVGHPDTLRLARLFLIGAMNGTLEWFHPGQASVEQIAECLTGLFLDGLLNHHPHAPPPARDKADGKTRVARPAAGTSPTRRKSS